MNPVNSLCYILDSFLVYLVKVEKFEVLVLD